MKFAVMTAVLLALSAVNVHASPLSPVNHESSAVQTLAQRPSAVVQADAGQKIRSALGPIVGEPAADAVAEFATDVPANENGGNRLLRLLILLFILSMLP
ncbi:MAG: hypothetical protein SFV23_16335 [Planctomycetaceae bacterium]|nr:hypothetical protein [Planctomycetaceae bacterium]